MVWIYFKGVLSIALTLINFFLQGDFSQYHQVKRFPMAMVA